jgi:hypothetical protein
MRCDIYVDESSQTAHQYLLLGGLILHTEDVSGFEDCILKARGVDLPSGELSLGQGFANKASGVQACGRYVLWQE